MRRTGTRTDRFIDAGVLIILATSIAFFVWELRSPLAQLDDAFISYRYAQNFVAGHGLVFNAGERVEGYTNLLWVLLIAMGIKLGFSAPIFGHWLCVASGILLLIASYVYSAALLPRSARIVAALAPLLLLSFNPFVLWTCSGLEQGLFSAFVTFALAAYVHKKIWLVYFLCVLSTLTRPEGALVAALILNVPWISVLFRQGWRDWRTLFKSMLPAVSFGGFLLALTLWRWIYYNDIVPNTFYAKVGGVPFGWGVFYLRQFFGDGPVFLMWGSLAALVMVPNFRVGFALFLIFFGYTLWVHGDVFPLGRFMLPVLPVMVASGLLATHEFFARGRGFSAAISMAMLVLAICFSLYVQPPGMRDGYFDFKLIFGSKFLSSAKRAEAHLFESPETEKNLAFRVQQILNANPPVHLVAAVGIGRLGYYGREIEVLDLVGLTNKVIAKSARIPAKGTFAIPGHQRSNPDYVFDRRPDLIFIPKKDTPGPLLPAVDDLWRDDRLLRDYYWDDAVGGYRRNVQ